MIHYEPSLYCVTGKHAMKDGVFFKKEVLSVCGLVVRVSDYRYRGPGFDPRRYQIFSAVVGLERGPLSLVRSIKELLE